MLLFLFEQIVLLLNESFEANFLHFTPEFIVLLLEVLDILVFNSQLADLICDLFLFLHQLLLEVIFDALNFFLFLC